MVERNSHVDVNSFGGWRKDYLHKPTKEGEIQEALDGYTGRLEFVKQLDPKDILGFEKDVIGNFSKDIFDAGVAEELEKVRRLYDFEDVHPPDLQYKALVANDERWAALKGQFKRVDAKFVAKAHYERKQILQDANHPFLIKLRSLYEAYLQNRFQTNPDSFQLPHLYSSFLETTNSLHAFQEFTSSIPPGEKLSRRLVFALGRFTPVSSRRVALPIASETMPQVVGDANVLATLAMMHAQACAPRNNIFSEPEKQADLLIEAINQIKNDPIFENRSDREIAISQCCSNLGILLEPNEYKALDRIETVLTKLYKNGIKPSEFPGYVRVYMVEGSNEMLETARRIQIYFPFLDINVGQFTSENQFIKFDTLARKAGIIFSKGGGVASGSRCSTGLRANVETQNVNFWYNVRKRGIMPTLFAETGIPHSSFSTALVAGINQINYSAGALGWLDANTKHWGLTETPDILESFRHIYDGEAGPNAKYAEGRVYKNTGIPFMLEGVDGDNNLNPLYPTIPHILNYLTETIVLTLAFHHKISLEDLQYATDIELLHMSEVMQAQIHPFKHY